MTDDREALARTWLAAMGAATAETLAQEPGATITPPLESAEASEERILALLARLRGDTQNIELGTTIGQGGMGVVHAAQQLALGRPVAVKALRPDIQSQEAALALLREAWVTGSLEHPNVVPVHDISVDEGGNPMIVLKRIEGVPWSQLIHDPETVRARFGAEDLMAWNLEIFGQVANAVRFAHSRGILHRDLKPDNVMIGAFGEVYLVDWGIAVSLRDDDSGRLPLARDATAMAGSPLYMAPEMLGRRAEELSERTDVYLLGSLLYEIMAGKPPHARDGAFAILRSVALSEPEFPEHAPAELARICRKAMACESDQRYPGVDALRVEVNRFVQHRGSSRLEEKARRDLGDLVELLDRGPGGDDQVVWQQRVYRLFGACRFGFLEALATWKDNQAAADGLAQAVTRMAERELAGGNARAAQTLLAELDHVPEALRERVRQALRDEGERDARLAELERMSADLDVSVDGVQRAIMGLIIAGSLVVVPLIIEWAGLVPAITHPILLGITLTFFILMVVGFAAARKSITWTTINRRVLGSMAAMLGAQVAVEIGFWTMGVDVVFPLVFLLLMWASAYSILGLTVEPVFWPICACFYVAFFVAVWRPELIAYCIAGGNLGVVVVAAVMGRRFQAQAGRQDQDESLSGP